MPRPEFSTAAPPPVQRLHGRAETCAREAHHSGPPTQRERPGQNVSAWRRWYSDTLGELDNKSWPAHQVATIPQSLPPLDPTNNTTVPPTIGPNKQHRCAAHHWTQQTTHILRPKGHLLRNHAMVRTSVRTASALGSGSSSAATAARAYITCSPRMWSVKA